MLDLYGSAPVNNSGIDPIQGFDFECWAQDSTTGQVAFFGRFQSLTISVRDATETYLELGQRIPIYLNGEIQIAWVLEQGLVDMGFITRTFGIHNIRRDQLISRGPRFHIAFDANAADRKDQTASSYEEKEAGAFLTRETSLLQGSLGKSPLGVNYFTSGQTSTKGLTSGPANSGRYEMMRCKVDSVSLGAMPGRRVAAVRWEGVSEGISFVKESLQTFKNSGAGTGNI